MTNRVAYASVRVLFIVVNTASQIVAAVCYDRPAAFKKAPADIRLWWKYAANAVIRLKRFGKVHCDEVPRHLLNLNPLVVSPTASSIPTGVGKNAAVRANPSTLRVFVRAGHCRRIFLIQR